MNYLNTVKKHVKEMEKAYGLIVTEETREKAEEEVWAGIRRMGLAEEVGRFEAHVYSPIPEKVVSGWPEPVKAVAEAAPLPIVTISEDLGVTGVTVVEVPVESKGTGFPGVSTTVVNGVTTVYPHDYEEGERGPGAFSHEIEGDTGVAERDIDPCMAPKVDMIGGWPERGEVEVWGLAPNRRHLRGKLGDGRVVTIERTFGREWKPNEKVTCRLVRAGAAPLFRVV